MNEREIAKNIAGRDDIEVGRKTIGIDISLTEIVKVVTEEIEKND